VSVREENLITALDVGSSKVCALVAEINDGALRYRGHGIAVSRGMRRGVVSELEAAVDSISEAVDAAEKSSGDMIASAVVGIGGPHVRGVNSHGGVSLGSRMREIQREEIRAAIDHASKVELPADREVLHVLPQEFLVDATALRSTCTFRHARAVRCRAWFHARTRRALKSSTLFMRALRRQKACCRRTSASWGFALRILGRSRPS
jgi:hypothetical protein